MGFFTVLSTGSHTFLHYHLRIPFVILSYSGLVFGNEAQLKEKMTANSSVMMCQSNLRLPQLETQCQTRRWSSVHLPGDKHPRCHKYLQSCQLTQQKGLRLTEHQDNYLSILADVMDESVLLTQACLKVFFLSPCQRFVQCKNSPLASTLTKVPNQVSRQKLHSA